MRRTDRGASLPGIELGRWLCGERQNKDRPCRAVVAAMMTTRAGRRFYVRNDDGPGRTGWAEWEVDEPTAPFPKVAPWCPRHGHLIAIDRHEVESTTARRTPRMINAVH